MRSWTLNLFQQDQGLWCRHPNIDAYSRDVWTWALYNICKLQASIRREILVKAVCTVFFRYSVIVCSYLVVWEQSPILVRQLNQHQVLLGEWTYIIPGGTKRTSSRFFSFGVWCITWLGRPRGLGWAGLARCILCGGRKCLSFCMTSDWPDFPLCRPLRANIGHIVGVCFYWTPSVTAQLVQVVLHIQSSSNALLVPRPWCQHVVFPVLFDIKTFATQSCSLGILQATLHPCG